MPKFSKNSRMKLETCHSDLIKLFDTVVKGFDCIIIEGHRSIERQQELYHQGRSKIDGVSRKGKHNYDPSWAVDVAPYFLKTPHVRWNDKDSFYYFAGYVKGIASILYENGIIKHQIRYGGDWDSDNDIHDQTFMDLVHFELV